MQHWQQLIPIIAFSLWLSACNSEGQAEAVGKAAAPQRTTDPVQLAHGRELFRQNCAQCHGAEAQGAFNWRARLPDGSFPPPPLNGTGHAWHHPRAMLRYVIRNGSPGGGNMPAWGGRLSDADIDATITWFQSRWPDEVYAAWWEIDQRARQARN